MPKQIAIAVVEHAGRYLIGRRPEGAPLAGLWEFPGGKTHADETPAACAARECLEETGLTIDVGELLTEVDYQYDHGAVRLHFFLCTPQDPAPQPQPPFHWVTVEELSQHEFPPANAGLLDLLSARHTGSASVR